MARRRRFRASKTNLYLAVMLIVLFGLASYPLVVGAVLACAVVAYGFKHLVRQRDQQRRRKALAWLQLHEVDTMDGRTFEYFVAELMASLGYTTEVTQASRDMGVDVIARKGSRRIAVQAKCYSSAVSGKAVGEALAGMPHYHCTECMVVTNSRFTSAAIRLAEPHPCTLVDRDGLARWLHQAQKSA